MLNKFLNKQKQESVQFYLDFLWEMTKRELIIRYKKTYLGFLWAILNPLAQMLIIGTVFSLFIKQDNYYLFIFIGLIFWQFYLNSTDRSSRSFIDSRNLLQKTKFPY